MSLELHENTHRRRTALADGNADAVWRRDDTCRLETLDAKYDAVAPLSLLADLDKSSKHRARYRALQDLMSDPRGAQCGDGEPRPIAASPSARGNAMARRRVRTATTVAAKTKAEAVHTIGGEIDGDAQPQGDGQLGH